TGSRGRTRPARSRRRRSSRTARRAGSGGVRLRPCCGPPLLALSEGLTLRHGRARLPRVVWELIFLMLVLTIPIVYLCLVVWSAIVGRKAKLAAFSTVTGSVCFVVGLTLEVLTGHQLY